MFTAGVDISRGIWCRSESTFAYSNDALFFRFCANIVLLNGNNSTLCGPVVVQYIEILKLNYFLVTTHLLTISSAKQSVGTQLLLANNCGAHNLSRPPT